MNTSSRVDVVIAGDHLAPIDAVAQEQEQEQEPADDATTEAGILAAARAGERIKIGAPTHREAQALFNTLVVEAHDATNMIRANGREQCTTPGGVVRSHRSADATRRLRGYDQCMQRASGLDHGETPWGAGPWRWGRNDGEPPRGARWFPVVFSLVVQSFVVVFALVRTSATTEIAAALVAMVGSFALLALRRWPGPTVAVVALTTFPAALLTSLPLPIALPLAFAMVGATVRGARVWVWSVASASLLIAFVFAFAVVMSPAAIVRPLVVTLILSVLVGIGETARNRRERFAELRAAAARRRQSEAERERVRIARELHDVLAHSLSSINVQAGVGLHLIEDQPEKAAEALANIKQTSKSALEEVRGVLGFLRSTGDGSDSADAAPRVPQPELANLPALLESAAALGVHVTVVGHAPSGMAQVAELAVYRVIQEALTNVSRHSTAKNASVSFVDEGDSLTVTVLDEGLRPPTEEPVEEGRGLLGMHERAALLGGTLDADWAAAGGFEVRLRVPITTGGVT